MEYNSELIYLCPLAFITILILDFVIIEIVLQLGVFEFGKASLRILMIIALEIQAIAFYLFNTIAEDNLKYMTVGAIAWIVWNPLYYYMLIEQNTYWMAVKVERWLYISLGFFSISAILTGLIGTLVSLQIVPMTYMEPDQWCDFVLLIYLSITEIFINYQIYQYCQARLKSVSLQLWKKVKISLIIFSLCILLDIIILILENFGSPKFAFQVKTCSFAFKIVFECMCFQFIKGIVFSIEQS